MELSNQELMKFKQILLNTFQEFIRICNENGLRYFVTGGTLIGTIRHQGFIPWDDDIDVWMFRSDYEKFVSIMRTSYQGNYEFVDIDTPNYYLPFAKFADKNTTIIESDGLACLYGVYVDIFVLDATTDSYRTFSWKKKLYDKCADCYVLCSIKRSFKSICEDLMSFSILKLIWHFCQFAFFPIFRPLLRLVLKYKPAPKKDEGALVCYGGGFKTDYIDKKIFERDCTASFESINVCIPCGYDKYLRQAYGDYMQLPPIEKRQSHHSHYYYNLERRVSIEEIKEIMRNNNNKIVLHCAVYAAPYAGNFIRSLCALEEKLLPLGVKMAYVFISNAKHQSWWEDFASKHLAYCTESDSEDGKSKELAAIINELDPVIIHTHFEGYDVPVAMAVKSCHSNAHIVWHMHDVLSYHQNPIKRLYQYFCFFRHYCYYGRGVSAIGVSKQILDFTSGYRRLLCGKFRKAEVIPNGVDLSRITINDSYQVHKPFTFLVYGGRNIQKRFDLVVNAASKLAKDFSFRLLITRGTDTDSVIKDLFPLQIPSWCQVISPKDNVSEVLSLCDCFVSCSIAEGHSYALCEATMFGLPVIQSDIPGNAWNNNSLSAYVFKSEDIDDLAEAMKKVMAEDFAILSRRIKETQSANVREYSLDAWCGKIVNFYEEVLSLH